MSGVTPELGAPVRSVWRIVGFGAAGALWIVVTFPNPYTGVAELLLALAVRGLYVFAMRRGHRNRAFWSPWVFVGAAILTVLSVIGQHGQAT